MLGGVVYLLHRLQDCVLAAQADLACKNTAGPGAEGLAQINCTGILKLIYVGMLMSAAQIGYTACTRFSQIYKQQCVLVPYTYAQSVQSRLYRSVTCSLGEAFGWHAYT